MTVLIDTNVILDYVLKREPHANSAFACIDYLMTSKAKIWLTASTITDIYYVTRRTLKDAPAAKKIIATLLNAFNISAVDKTDCLNALDIPNDDYEDALVSTCASKIKAAYIITRNLKDFTDSTVPAISPDEYVKKYATKKPD